MPEQQCAQVVSLVGSAVPLGAQQVPPVQVPMQHGVVAEHPAPSHAHAVEQRPLVQMCVQQSTSDRHVAPIARQLSAWQTCARQLCEQQPRSIWHGPPLSTHVHTSFTHSPEQHDEGPPQHGPDVEHGVPLSEQSQRTPLQNPLQHSSLWMQGPPVPEPHDDASGEASDTSDASVTFVPVSVGTPVLHMLEVHAHPLAHAPDVGPLPEPVAHVPDAPHHPHCACAVQLAQLV